MEPKIKIQDFTYFLPEVKIAKYPLTNRDDSTILIFRDNLISESKFSNLAQQIPDNSFMVFNNTKVVPARLFLKNQVVPISKYSVLNLTLLLITHVLLKQLTIVYGLV